MKRRSKKQKEAYVLGYTIGNVSKRTGESRSRVKRWLKKAVKDSTTCPFCKAAISLGTFAVDHKTPISRGGSPSLLNCWLICAPCNRAKGSLTVEEFTALRATLATLGEFVMKNVLVRLRLGGAMYKG